MAQLNAKLEHIRIQIETARQHDAGQAELFLVINRLEEFATAIQERLTCLDFETKRGIIRALVKRIEIYHDEILVVFGVDPDPDIGDPEEPSEQSSGALGMQDCKRRCLSTLCKQSIDLYPALVLTFHAALGMKAVSYLNSYD